MVNKPQPEGSPATNPVQDDRSNLSDTSNASSHQKIGKSAASRKGKKPPKSSAPPLQRGAAAPKAMDTDTDAETTSTAPSPSPSVTKPIQSKNTSFAEDSCMAYDGMWRFEFPTHKKTFDVGYAVCSFFPLFYTGAAGKSTFHIVSKDGNKSIKGMDEFLDDMETLKNYFYTKLANKKYTMAARIRSTHLPKMV